MSWLINVNEIFLRSPSSAAAYLKKRFYLVLRTGFEQRPAWMGKQCAVSIEILTAHEGNGGKLLSRGEIQPLPTIHRGPH